MKILEENVKSVRYVVQQIESLQKNILSKLENSEEVEDKVLPMMSETMLTVAELIGGEITDKQWIEFYSLMSENKMPTDFMAGLAEWEIIVNTWCDRTDIQIMREKLKEMDQEKKNIKELIGALSKLVKQVNNQEERIARLYSNYNVRKGWYLEINE